MEPVTPHLAAVAATSEPAALDESELHVQWSEFVLHPLRSLAAAPIVLSVAASATPLE